MTAPTAQVGLGVAYRTPDGRICLGQIIDLAGANVNSVLYFDQRTSDWRVSPKGIVQDDTQAANNSWAVLTFYTP